MRTSVKPLLVLALAAGISSCAVFTPLPEARTLTERLAMFPTQALPLSGPVTVWWNEHQVPFVEAATDRDAAFTLGLVHAHLRLGQMEVLRRISQARISEMAGPVPQVGEIEHALRILNLGKTSAAVYSAMPAHSKDWLDPFVEVDNLYQGNGKHLPHEYALLGLEKELWRSEEILTMGRLASVDVSWLVWVRLMPLRERKDWPQLWRQVLEEGTTSAPSFAWNSSSALNEFSKLLSTVSRTGSNSMVVSAAKTGTGAAMIASDPHLGISLPNLWLLAGVKSPSYSMVGYMVPGVPFVAVGRNDNVAWGGTNMRSAGSDLIDVRAIAPEQITERVETVHRRWWFDSEVTIRETPYGPILSDAAVIPKLEGDRFALRWIGHNPSDEITAMLSVNRAKNWNDFRTALEGFSISPQNFLFADIRGNIGQVTATHLPKRSKELPKDVILPVSAATAWDEIVTSRDLPSSYNPSAGFLASANNRGAEADIPVGYFFSSDDRVTRMQQLLSALPRVTTDDLKRIQMDTFASSSVAMRDAIAARLRRETLELTLAQKRVADAVTGWNGRYDRNSAGAVAFEAMMTSFMPAAFAKHEIETFDTIGSPYAHLAPLVSALDAAVFRTAVLAGLASAETAMTTYAGWGDMHRLVVQAQFAAIPVIGGRYVFDDVAASGSSETVLKTDHETSAERHPTRYGAQARHVSDLSDSDANWFVMLGGNDGWYNSSTFRDQVDAFQTGASFKVPLRIETVRATFPNKAVLSAK